MSLRSKISNMRNGVSLGYPDTEKWLENKAQLRFLTHYEVFECKMKHSMNRLIKLLKLTIKCRENEGIKQSKSMQVKTGNPNLYPGCDFLCVLVHEL